MPYIPPTTHINLLATLRRERRLPVDGDLAVQLNQRVEAQDVIARGVIADEHYLKDVARDLGLPPEKADACLIKEAGETVQKGEVFAVRKGLFQRASRAPVTGLLVVAGEGKALFSAFTRTVELRAGIAGVVSALIPKRGAIIETTGALLEGIWGNGREDCAILRMVSSGLQDPLLTEQVEVGLHGSIIAAGVLANETTLRQLIEVRVRGLIVGSMAARLIPAVKKAPFPVLVTDGFGGRGFSPIAYSLLTNNDQREIWVNAQVWDRFAGRRPEAIIPLPRPGEAPPPPADGNALDTDKHVRISRGAHAGRKAKVVELPARTVILPSGVRAPVAIVELDLTEGMLIQVPFANLEILE